jgi:hypothetical protein
VNRPPQPSAPQASSRSWSVRTSTLLWSVREACFVHSIAAVTQEGWLGFRLGSTVGMVAADALFALFGLLLIVDGGRLVA